MHNVLVHSCAVSQSTSCVRMELGLVLSTSDNDEDQGDLLIGNVFWWIADSCLIQFGACLKYKAGFVFGIILQFEVVQFRDNGRDWGHFHTFHGPFKAGAKEWEDYNSCASLYNQVVALATCLCTDWHWPFERAACQSLNNSKMQVMVSLTKYLVALQEEGFGWRTP